MEVCWRLRPIASATLMNRLAKSVSKIGSGPFDSAICGCARGSERNYRGDHRRPKLMTISCAPRSHDYNVSFDAYTHCFDIIQSEGESLENISTITGKNRRLLGCRDLLKCHPCGRRCAVRQTSGKVVKSICCIQRVVGITNIRVFVIYHARQAVIEGVVWKTYRKVAPSPANTRNPRAPKYRIRSKSDLRIKFPSALQAIRRQNPIKNRWV